MKNEGLEDEMFRDADFKTQEILDEMAGYGEKPATIDVPYCICRKSAEGWMIACDGGCEDWFHGSCVSLKEEDSVHIDEFICPACEINIKGCSGVEIPGMLSFDALPPIMALPGECSSQ